MSGNNIKYKGREGNNKDKQTMTITIFLIINSYLLFYNRSDLPSII